MANERGQYGSPKSTGILNAATPEELIQDQARANLEARGIHDMKGYEPHQQYLEQLRQEATRLRGSPTAGPMPDHSPGTALVFLGATIALVWGLSKVKSAPKLPKIDLPAAYVVQR